ncbi:MAG TPA: SulP family inorganic anion transporter [Puia sp.]|jgi:SulP family sulfate permease|nr:SulP family inorganic anion transporter [Puia sp.]
MFRPKLYDTLKNYSSQQFGKDLMAGLIVGIVALPLAIAFAIASGVSPEKGLFTAIIGGFVISALGGSRVQIGGPTGAFIVIVYGIVQQYGMASLVICTFMAGFILILMGIARLGSVIKFVPQPLIIGFTSGIALIIFSSEIKDFLGLNIGAIPAGFIEKWKFYFENLRSINFTSPIIGLTTIGIIIFWPKLNRKIPGSLVGLVITTAVVQIFHLHVETIGSRFGGIKSVLPMPSIPTVSLNTIRNLVRPAFTIALLGGIESLLSAVVADGMIGGNHRSNMELVAQGTANIFSSLFGGIPATGAIARTATNVKNGGRTPVAGMIHSLTLLVIMVFVGKWAALIPMACLSGILIVVAYNMSEMENFRSVLKGPRSDALVLLTTFFLTVLIDLTVAIEIGMVMAAFLFMRNMIRITDVSNLSRQIEDEESESDPDAVSNYEIPKQVEVFEINGPLFFGAAYKFKDAIRYIEKTPRVLIIRMRYVPIIDATGIQVLKEVLKESTARGTKMILSGITSEQVLEELQKSRILFAVGKANIQPNLKKALERSLIILTEQHYLK